ncbi:MAG TPA: hypothetical protein VK918_01315 [Pyrinomonadaceae bacterium]|nr:hypothetical protein [Pyrinomonadaceae bacterium]
MLHVLLMIQILMGVSVCLAQADPPKPIRAAEVKTAVEKLSALRDVRVRGVLFDMRVFDGKFTDKDDNTFTVDSKRQGLPRSVMVIKYEQVLELVGPGIAISYFPDPDTAPYSTWDELKRIVYGDTLEIDRVDGTGTMGVFIRVTGSEMVLLDGNKDVSIKREEIKRVFLARREPHSLKKAAKGAGKAAGTVRPAEPASRTLGSSAGAAMINGVILLGTAAAGAIHSVARPSPNDRLLLYAK